MKGIRKCTAFLIATIMMASNIAPAFASTPSLDSPPSEIINSKTPVIPAKLGENETAADIIKNPDQPDIYTLRTDYKVQRGEKYEINYQPYIASVGADASDEEKEKVKQEITLPDIAGYDKSQLEDSYTINYNTVKKAAEGQNKRGTPEIGLRYQANRDFRYKAKANQIKVKHVFQDLEDFNKYTNPDGTITSSDGEKGTLIEKGGSVPVEVTDKEVKKHERITTQNGNTGSTMEVSPLEDKDNDREGFVPERAFINMQVPENAENFILEYRYNRAHYDVYFDTMDGSPVPTRTLYFGQTIPRLDFDVKKAGSDLQGWKVNRDITYVDQAGNEQTLSKDTLIKKEDFENGGKFENGILYAMPAGNLTFIAQWKDKTKADYVIQFWTEKPDYDDKDDSLPLRDRYEFIGARRVDGADTGSTPDLTNLDIHGITFPDLNDGRLEKAQDDKKEFERYYFLNEELTQKQNASEKDPKVQKSVSSTGETVYNVYYDRRVYTLYFTAASGEAFDIVGSFWPIITRDGKVIGKEGSPYKVDVRFNQSLDKIWPKDAEVSNLPTSYGNEQGDTGLIGWTINNNAGEQAYRDTPPYRLSAEDFIDSQDVVGTGEFEGFGHSDQIPIKDGENKKRDKYEISIGSTSYEQSVVHHIDIIKDDFDGKEQIDYDMSYWKSDTSAAGPNGYPFGLPHLQGFTLKEDTRTAEWIGLEKGRVGTWDARKTFDELNKERNKKTPFRSDADKIEYIDQFPWGTKSFKGANAYNYANYSRNSYKLKLNNDPKTVKNDSEYGAGNILDVPYELPLNDLKLDTTHKPQKPNWVRDDWSFLGWALDPAGENLVKAGKETKLHYDQILYAKWGEPDYKWKVIFDPNGGSLRTIDENKLTTERKTVKEGDIGQEKETTYPIKEKSEGDKQVFKVVHKQELVEPKFKPVRRGYDFMGWEVIRYKKNEKGDYTDEVDTSYRDTYKVPELYSFGNEVVSPIYLKAIWVPNARVDVKVEHYMLDKDYNLVEKLEDTLEGKRANYLVATTGDRQDDKYTLVPHDELDEKLTGDLKTIYEEYNNRVKLNNSFFQTFRVESEEIPDSEDSEKMIPNPDVKNNVFKFFYRPYRQREYKVNYIDENFKGKENEKAGAIIDQELVVNGNRHYDARNYRPIPGWVLTSDPQQQLFFDVDENTNEFKGINGTGKDEITFYYKDVRVIEIPTPKEGEKIPDPPKGYVRVTFKADKGGDFGKDKNGKPIKELHYDVIKGLKSDLLPVPGNPTEDDEKEADKYYISPDTGKKFTKWDDKPLLNKNTIVNNEGKDFYVFTAKFEWSGLTASGLVITEAFKDPNSTWTNDFAPTIDQLKAQLVWREKDQIKDLPAGTEIKLYDEAGNELTKDDQVYDLVNEKKALDKDQLVRTVNIKAKVTFKDGKEPQELEIPITVYKNVYEALTGTAKPLFLSQAEKGELKDITGEYVKVTVAPTGDLKSKDNKVYYVNKNAWVEIPEVDTKDNPNFTNWTADKAEQNEGQVENGIYDFAKRHKFTEDTVISPRFAKDVVEQEDPNKKPDVPNSYVKVIVKTTDKATDDTAFEKTFWVNPTREVSITVANPEGKIDQEVDIPLLGKKNVNYVFKEWQKVQAGEADDKLTEVKPPVKIDLAKNKYTDKVTVIEAAYKKSIQPGKIEEPLKTKKLDTPQGKEITKDDLIKQITPQEGKEIESIEVISKPDGNTVGNEPAKVIVKYKDGSTQGTNDKPVIIPVEVHEKIIPAGPNGEKPEKALDNYVKVIFKAGTGGSLSGDTVYYVSPEVEVDMTDSAKAVTKTPSVGYYVNGENWSNKDNKALKGTFTDPETEFVFIFDKYKDIVEKTDDPNQVIPKGYVKVTFKTEDEAKGKLEDDVKEKIYYVNPKAGITLKVLGKNETATDKQLAVPKTVPAEYYEDDKWYEEIDTENPIISERIHVAKFKLAKVTLTYDAGGATTGTVPESVTVDHGTSVALANPGSLAKDNSSFAGWKLDGDEKIYYPGDQVTLERVRTATAQWTTNSHTVSFDTKGGSKVDSQSVEHGKMAKNPAAPNLDGKVFMGWKENESDESYFDFTTPITSDKTLIAIWQDSVQKIGENDQVEKEFIKVTFIKGNHGTLSDGKNDGLDKVIYKVAKSYTIDQAKENGLFVPVIAPDKYYKVKAENQGWDKVVELSGQDVDFTAQYEPEADVIPVDPEVTDEDKIKDETPDEMVLVEFVVDENEAYMDGITKYYVAKNKEVEVPSPLVFNKKDAQFFKGWIFNNEITMDIKGSFSEDTKISDKILDKPDIHIKVPGPGKDFIELEDITEGAQGKLEVISNGQSEIYGDVKVKQRVRRGRRFVTQELHGFKLGQQLKIGDIINFWATNENGDSKVYQYTIE